MPSQPDTTANLGFIREAARLYEPDRYICAVLAPRAVRDDLITLAAYFGDVRRIPLTVSEATLGEIRLQWWRDTLEAGAQGGVSGNPIADELVRVIARHDLPLGLVLAPLEAVSAELTGEPLDNDTAWLSYLDNGEGAALHLSARCIDDFDTSKHSPAVSDAGRALAAIRLGLRLPELLAKARWPVPPPVAALGDPRQCSEADAKAIVRRAGDMLAAEATQYLAGVRTALAQGPSAPISAILPAALVPAYAKAITRPSRDALREPAQIAPLTRILRLWWASQAHRI
jgi:15-cis-phytoene synthase